MYSASDSNLNGAKLGNDDRQTAVKFTTFSDTLAPEVTRVILTLPDCIH